MPLPSPDIRPQTRLGAWKLLNDARPAFSPLSLPSSAPMFRAFGLSSSLIPFHLPHSTFATFLGPWSIASHDFERCKPTRSFAKRPSIEKNQLPLWLFLPTPFAPCPGTLTVSTLLWPSSISVLPRRPERHNASHQAPSPSTLTPSPCNETPNAVPQPHRLADWPEKSQKRHQMQTRVLPFEAVLPQFSPFLSAWRQKVLNDRF